MAGFTNNFLKRELIITMKSHNNNSPSVVFTLLRVRACVCIYIPSYTEAMRVIFSNCSPLKLSKRPNYSWVLTRVCELPALLKSRP